MQLWNKSGLLWLMAVCSILGIIGMLLMDGIVDIIFLIITLLPVLIAGWRAYLLQQRKR
ncbi:MAG: hypothetical protein LBQ29_03565 [Acinetobacter sp.]|jgi:hypothetical protein|uniref:Uncharacterized protein n=1 Tax=Acinetobacter courvalinii TaxID=280147 RepID=A0AA42L8Y4_9GAMM|nr:MULTISPECIES: hypothetical protein [Acinetobacter]MBJ9958867.1 hypothetical protein [Acinetobacter courvalinii]MDH0565658.1 hypothetical protein [Acinetobacter courvalinii]MDR2060459.1 hypothetical protein [Acinetobacter sp.]